MVKEEEAELLTCSLVALLLLTIPRTMEGMSYRQFLDLVDLLLPPQADGVPGTLFFTFLTFIMYVHLACMLVVNKVIH